MITLEELAKHTSDDDAWIAINGEVYDVSRYYATPSRCVHMSACLSTAMQLSHLALLRCSLLSMHPGGSGILLRHAGSDASLQFGALGHTDSSSVAVMQAGLHIGHLVKDTTNAPPQRLVIVGAGEEKHIYAALSV
jgi:hypothetical protein